LAGEHVIWIGDAAVSTNANVVGPGAAAIFPNEHVV
jgi:hypothetical protein